MTAQFRARLEALRTDGLTLAAIAAVLSREFDHHYSRNSVAGVVHRLGLPPLPKAPRATKRPPAPQAKRRHPLRCDPVQAAVRFAAALNAAAPRQQGPDDSTIPQAQRLTLMELRAGRCRWPVGDPRKAGFFFCGSAAHEGPYCTHHRARSRAEGGAL
jgi:GcrA cell cycle regulator